ncbi:ECF transporter S component [Lactococcus nasutitermitis]|uniref:ECF transporter S component n=1 Tax=Lactococcus nasutitermitis TaxID=1652957 RepID=A0ABV9JA79_9LACT|nr:ECF transporter S component [Lactococcus nasutitermitis]
MRQSKAFDIAILSILIATMIVIQVLSTIVYSVWPMPISPTIAGIPVIIASVVLGPKRGAIVGFAMGLILFIQATITPGVTNWLFTPFIPIPGTNHGSGWALIVTFVPRILIGVFPYYAYKLFKNRFGAGLAGFIGSITNTILVLGFIFLFFGSLLKWSFAYLITAIIATNSLVEAAAAVILTAAIVPALMKMRGK